MKPCYIVYSIETLQKLPTKGLGPFLDFSAAEDLLGRHIDAGVNAAMMLASDFIQMRREVA